MYKGVRKCWGHICHGVELHGQVLEVLPFEVFAVGSATALALAVEDMAYLPIFHDGKAVCTRRSRFQVRMETLCQ
jgi:hypothetical protein